MRKAWRELLFADPDLRELRETRDPVLVGQRSPVAKAKIAAQQLPDGSRVYCFRTLIEHLETITVNRCEVKGAGEERLPFELTSLPNDKQRRALDLLKTITIPEKNNTL